MKDDLDALKRSVDMVTLLTNYGVELKQRGNEYDALCIWHTETTPSMQVYIDSKDGHQRAHCKSCGKGGTVIDVVMEMDCCDKAQAIAKLKVNGFQRDDTRIKAEAPIKPATWQHTTAPDSMPNMHIKDNGDPVATWRYNDAEGKCLGYVARYLKPNGDKDYRPWTFGSYSINKTPAWSCKVWTYGRRPLYGLDLLAANPTGKVIISEGEKSSDASRHYWASRIGIAWPGGANSIAAVDWQPLAGRDVLLVPDADITGVGESAMFKVASYILPLGCKVSILDTSDKPNKWDLADALRDGLSKDDLMAWAAPRVSAVSSREIEKQKLAEEKKTMQAAQAVEPEPMNPLPMEDWSIYDLPPLPDELDEPKHIPLTIDVVPEQIPDAPAIKPAKVKRHTAIRETMVVPAGDRFSDVTMAEIWAENEGVDWNYCHSWSKWLRWDGSRWMIDNTRSACRLVADEMKRASHWPESSQLSVKDKRTLCSVGKIASVLKHAETLKTIARECEDFDRDMFLLGTPNGTVDLRTGILREPDRADMITKQTLCAPKRGPHPTWDKVLARCTKGNPDVRAYFQRWWGYMLTGSCKEEAMNMIVGPGASGKTKYLMVADILGDYLQECDIGLLMESKIERHSSELASLEGARIVRCTEPEEGSRFNESILKRLTGREKIAARRLYSEVHTYTVQFKIILGSNFRPSLKSTGEEIRRRIHFVDFPDSIPEADRDYDLDKKLEAEYPAILQWMIDGCIEWQRIGLSKPDSVKASTNAYLGEEDTLGHWLSDCCTIGSDRRVLSGEAYKSYAAFVEAAGEGVVSQKRFSQRLETRGFVPGRSSKGRHFDGFDLTPAVQTSWVDTDRDF